MDKLTAALKLLVQLVQVTSNVNEDWSKNRIAELGYFHFLGDHEISDLFPKLVDAVFFKVRETRFYLLLIY